MWRTPEHQELSDGSGEGRSHQIRGTRKMGENHGGVHRGEKKECTRGRKEKKKKKMSSKKENREE